MAAGRAVRQTRGMRHPALTLVAAALALPACNAQLNLGSGVLWSARHETGDLREWLEAGKGGTEADAPDTALAISTDYAHSGRYAVKLTNGAVSTYEDAHLWRQDDYPVTAYYSAWFYLPRAYQTTADWSIMQFQVPTADAGVVGQLLDVDLRSLPTGDLILSVYDHRAAYLRAPTPDPAMPVPIGRWFQVEALYRNAGDDTGEVAVWLDGQLNYDLHRPFGANGTVYWTVGSKTEGLSPAESVIYLDDAAVSLVRVTPAGTL
ncbi:MAG TPA: heparin lyase I family protein [Polyangia bacterium]|nr:heparin lyase I family protein [Polyangia bacterium]